MDAPAREAGKQRSEAGEALARPGPARAWRYGMDSLCQALDDPDQIRLVLHGS